MGTLTHHEITFLLLALGVLLALARILGEVSQRLGQPAVIGEILAGILLGPTVLGRIWPGLSSTLFPSEGAGAVALEGLTTLAIALFLLVAGMEIDLSSVWRQGRRAVIVGVAGIAVPFAVGFGLGWIVPERLGADGTAEPLVFALFIATALSISALPVVAKVLMDLNLFRTDIGMTVMAAAVFNDLVGWIVFAIILAMMGGGGETGPGIATTIWLTLAFAAVTFTAGRWIVDRILPWVQAHASWPGGVLGLVLAAGLTGAAFTEWLGVHAIFGAFMVGVAIGDSRHLTKQTRTTLEQFIGFIFAPLFFASLGLYIDFAANFDLLLTLIVFAIATFGKVAGCLGGARLAGIPPREGFAIAFGMNARGAMEIILGLLALQVGLINEALFVALVIMAIGTSILSGPLMQWVLRREVPGRFFDYLSPEGFVGHLEAQTRREAIHELTSAVASEADVEPEALFAAVWHREQLMPTGLARRVAVPNARVPGIAQPIVGLGLSSRGIDFDAADGQSAQIICLLLVPEDNAGGQWEILSDISQLMADSENRERLLRVSGFTELRALFKIAHEEQSHGEPEEQRPRQGYVIIGANSLARAWARRLVDLGTTVWLVDSNRDHVDAAIAEGLNAVAGNAAREETLMAAHAFGARSLVALTPNEYINVDVARLAHETFGIPECWVAVTDARNLPEDDWIHGLTIEPRHLRPGRETLLDRGGRRWERLVIDEPGELTASLAVGRVLTGLFVPLFVERGEAAETWPTSPGMPLLPEDTVHGLVVLEPDGKGADKEHLLRAVERAPVLDVAEAIDSEAFFRLAAEALSQRLSKHAEDLVQLFGERERVQSVVLTPELAVPHLRLDGEGVFEVLIGCAPHGVQFGDGAAAPTAMIVLVSTHEHRRQHLQILAAVARMAQRPDFADALSEASDAESLRAWIMEEIVSG